MKNRSRRKKRTIAVRLKPYLCVMLGCVIIMTGSPALGAPQYSPGEVDQAWADEEVAVEDAEAVDDSKNEELVIPEEETAQIQESEENGPLLPHSIATEVIIPSKDNHDAWATWVFGLDKDYLVNNIENISGGKFSAESFELTLTGLKGNESKATAAVKLMIVLQNASDQGRSPSALEREYVATLQEVAFGEVSSYWRNDASADSGSSPMSAGPNPGEGDYHYDGSPGIGKYPSKDAPGNGVFRKGLILGTDDPVAGLFPTGHAAILYDPVSNTAMSSFPQFASRNDPQLEGVQTEPNDWWDFHGTCFVVDVTSTTNAQEVEVANWCHNQTGKPYNLAFWDTSTRDSFYCSQLVWAGFKDLYGIDLWNDEGWGGMIHPMSFKHSSKTSLLYQHGQVNSQDTGWVDVDNDLYYIDASGAAHTGWLDNNNQRFYFDQSSGIMLKGWQAIAEKRYYFTSPSGAAAKGWEYTSSGYFYFIPPEEATAKNPAYTMANDCWFPVLSHIYHFDSNGIVVETRNLYDESSPELVVIEPELAFGTKSLDITAGSLQSGAVLQLYKANYTRAQLFEIIPVDGFYYIRNVKSNMFLQPQFGNAISQSQVVQMPFAGEDAQKWVIEYLSDSGSVIGRQIAPKINPDLVLDVKDGRSGNISELQLFGRNNTPAQHFHVIDRHPYTDGNYKILSRRGYYALDVVGGSTAVGANVQMYSDNGTLAQRWVIISYNHNNETDSTPTTIINAKSRMALDIPRGKAFSGANVQVYDRNNTDAQRWEIC